MRDSSERTHDRVGRDPCDVARVPYEMALHKQSGERPVTSELVGKGPQWASSWSPSTISGAFIGRHVSSDAGGQDVRTAHSKGES
jgi:hypothetical protein